MKVLVYKVNSNKNRKDKGIRKRKSLERLLYFSFLIAFTLLIVVQTAFMNSSVRTFFSLDGEKDGTMLGAEEYLYHRGEVSLELQSEDANQELVVLLNGEPCGSFMNKTLKVRVKDGDVIELDGSALKAPAEVHIASASTNIQWNRLNRSLTLRSGVHPLTVIHMESLQ